jgi:hypothetical protein
MKHVKFLPWIGENYEDGFNGLRTLVLGESHYESLNNPSINDSLNETIECVKEQANGDWSKAFWTKIATALIGRKPTLDEKSSFGTAWHIIIMFRRRLDLAHGLGRQRRVGR